MGIFGSAVGGLLGIGGTIFGGISASKAMKRYKRNIENEQNDNLDWYNRRWNEDATQRADAQRILAITNQNIRDRNRAAAGTAAVMGGTEESVAATKAANAQAMADAASQIAVAGARRKDAVDEAYRERKAALDDKLDNLELKKAGYISEATQKVGETAGNIAGLF